MLRITLASLLLLTGCAGSPPAPDNRAPAEKLSESVGDTTGKVAGGLVRGVIEFIPGLEAGINGISKQLDNRNKRARDRKAGEAQAERDSFKMQYCISNECNPACREFLTERAGITPHCDNQTTQVKPVVRPNFQPSSYTPTTPTPRPKPESTIVEHEGLRTDVYEDKRGIAHVGVGSRVWEDVDVKTSDDIVDRFAADLDHAESVAKEYAGELAWRRATESQRLALIEIAFALGRTGINKFIKMREYINAVEWNAAARELENSKWYESDTERVKTLANNLKTTH